MTLPFEGITVVEVAGYIFVPSAGGVLADLGADVIKVEPLTGDPMRRSSQLMAAGSSFDGLACLVEGANRGKRSIALDLRQPAARPVLERLVGGADVFTTSYLPGVRRRLAVDVDDIRAINPDVIYAKGSGWGARGPMADEPAFDTTAAWASSGAAVWFGTGYDRLPVQPYGFYDAVAGHDLAGAIGTALFQRLRTGRAPTVDVSLLNVGWWAMQAMISAGAMGNVPAPNDPLTPANPMVNTYATADGRFLVLSAAEGDHLWAQLCELIDRPHLAADSRFAARADRQANAGACAAELRAAFAGRPLADWCERLATFAGAWAPMLAAHEVAAHQQAAANGFINDSVTSTGATLPVVAPPLQLDGCPTVPRGPTPRLGEHTDEILRGLDFSADDVMSLRDVDVVA